jgi:hypothetical protein
MSREGQGAAVIFTAVLASIVVFGVWAVLGTLTMVVGASVLADNITKDS